jgi:hypothetical protein
MLPHDARTELLDLIAKAGIEVPADIRAAAENGDLSAKALLPYIINALNATDRQTADALTRSQGFTQLFHNLLVSDWSLTPEQLKAPHAIERYYEHLEENLEKIERLTAALTAGGAADTVAANIHDKAANLRDNIDFMKTLNQVFTYFQIPVKLSEKMTHAELYVYSKRKPFKQNEAFSVLLHLDLTYAGPMDIRLQLQGKIISSDIYAEKESIPVVNSELPELEEILSKKGYLFSAHVSPYKKPVDIVQDFIAEDDNIPLEMKRYTFDVRACGI